MSRRKCPLPKCPGTPFYSAKLFLENEMDVLGLNKNYNQISGDYVELCKEKNL
jgi:hypothetical protein